MVLMVKAAIKFINQAVWKRETALYRRQRNALARAAASAKRTKRKYNRGCCLSVPRRVLHAAASARAPVAGIEELA